MSARNLTQARIDALTPRKTVRNIRDGALKGFGIRVLPSGAKRFFIHTQRYGRRIWKIVGDANTVSLDEARRLARDLIASMRTGGAAPASSEDMLFEVVAEEVFRNYGRNWKPRTMRVNRGYLQNQILPWFAGRKIADVTRSDVQRWFASLHSTPVAADRSAPILSVILRQAEVYGYRREGSNPCSGMRRYCTKGRERFLSGEELRRLARTLDHHESSRPLHVAFIRLLLLTGCRKSEIATLEWSSYREGHLFLPDSKTGPRTVWLSSPARAVFERLPRTGRWVFPARRARKPLCTGAFDAFWWRIRAEADLRDVRLHDLRHTYASIAIMQGESVVTTGRLLGHNSSETTLKYAHLSDSSVRKAVNVLGAVLAEGRSMPRRRRLTDAAIAKLRPEPREFTVWDTRVPGLGVRVRPTGLRTYIHHLKSAAGVKKVSLGPATSRGIEEVRQDCLAAAAAVAEEKETVREDVPLFRDFVAGVWKSACFDHWKPSTQRVTNRVLRSQLLPAFGAARLDRITHLMVVRWFEAYSRTAPGGANRVLDVLRQILNHAIVCGHIATNPTRSLRRNPRAKLTRFLSCEEIQRLHRVLDSHVKGSESARQQADIIRLLLLTGCRKSEIVRLHRKEVDGDRLNLSASKTGPRRVLLNARAREIIERRMNEGEGPWLFPSGACPSRPQGDGLYLWYLVRRKAGLEDVRLHDLRHTVATHAVMQGIPLPIVARLLGHRRPDMTLRYTHVGDAEVKATAERIGQAIALLMAGESPVAEG